MQEQTLVSSNHIIFAHFVYGAVIVLKSYLLKMHNSIENEEHKLRNLKDIWQA